MALPSSAEKAAVVRAMFDRIAPRYDALNRLFSLRLDQYWRRVTVHTVAISAWDTVVDLACGTGDLSELAVQAGARVVGVDFAANMLAGALRRRIAAAFVQADVSCLAVAAGRGSVEGLGVALWR